MNKRNTLIRHLKNAYEEAFDFDSFSHFAQQKLNGQPVTLKMVRNRWVAVYQGKTSYLDTLNLKNISARLQRKSKNLSTVFGKYSDDVLRWLEVSTNQLSDHAIKKIVFLDNTGETMSADHQTGTVVFNYRSFKKAGIRHYRTVIAHELIHLLRHNVPNYSDVKVLRRLYGEVIMQILDVNADVEAACYLKERCHFSLRDFYGILFEGQNIFRETNVEAIKLDRFLGTVIASYIYFTQHTRSVYVPNSDFFKNNNKMVLLIADKGNFAVNTIKLPKQVFRKIFQAYKGGHARLSKEKYVDQLVLFAQEVISQLSLINPALT